MNIFMILGNGFTIDYIDFLKISNKINVKNLFSEGDNVPWPSDDSIGFLSYKYCPNLWNLGARPNISSDDGLILIEDIITCANMLNDNFKINSKDFYQNKIYLSAYKELVQYLNSLFIYYNSNVTDKTIIRLTKEWNWYKYIKRIAKDGNIEKIYIITLNYDIWLERILMLYKIDFNVVGFENNDSKIQIFKPHGSISFQSKIIQDKEAFGITYDFDIPQDATDQFEIKYKGITPLGSLTALIPPAGDSSRMIGNKWSKTIREEIGKTCSLCKNSDELILCGVSYWHVDRAEIDQYLGHFPADILNVKIYNPKQPPAFNAVLTTYFNNVINYITDKNLE